MKGDKKEAGKILATPNQNTLVGEEYAGVLFAIIPLKKIKINMEPGGAKKLISWESINSKDINNSLRISYPIKETRKLEEQIARGDFKELQSLYLYKKIYFDRWE